MEHYRFLFEIISVIGGIGAIIIGIQQLNRTVESTNRTLEASQHQLEETQYESVYQHQLDLWQLAAGEKDVAAYITGGKKLTDKVSESEKTRAAQRAALANALDFYAYVFTQLAPSEENKRPPADILVAKERPAFVEQSEWDGWVPWASTLVEGFEGAPGMCDSLNEKDVHGNYAYEGAFRTAVSEAVPNCVK